MAELSRAGTRKLSRTWAGGGLAVLAALVLLFALGLVPLGNSQIKPLDEEKGDTTDIANAPRAKQRARTTKSDAGQGEGKISRRAGTPKRITRSRHDELADALSKNRRTEAAPRLPPDMRGVPDRNSHTAAPVSVRPLVDDADPGVLDKQYIRDRIQEIVPLIQECYEREIPGDARAVGDIKVRFTIEGDPTVGGIVGESTVLGGSLAQYKDFIHCVTETMITLEFIAPDDDGMVTVEYPFSFGRE